MSSPSASVEKLSDPAGDMGADLGYGYRKPSYSQSTSSSGLGSSGSGKRRFEGSAGKSATKRKKGYTISGKERWDPEFNIKPFDPLYTKSKKVCLFVRIHVLFINYNEKGAISNCGYIFLEG